MHASNLAGMRIRRTLALAILLASAVIGIVPSNAALVPVGWVPNSWGLPPFAIGTSVAYFSRRIVADPTIPGRFALGHLIYGMYQNDPGAGWVSTTPHCLSLARTLAPEVAQQAEDALHLLGGCGVEGIAFDRLDPLALYASTYNLKLELLPNNTLRASFAPGGLYKSSFPLLPTPAVPKITTPQIGPIAPKSVGPISPIGPTVAVETAGVTWTKLLEGIRGNVVAARHLPPATSAVTLAVGRIQASDSPPSVGTDSNVWCNAYTGPLPTGVGKCSPSLYISKNGGATWTTRYFTPPPGCPNGSGNVASSSQLVGNAAFDEENPNVMYAGANSGFYWSKDGGDTWNVGLESCGGSLGFAATVGSNQRIYVGTNSGELYTGSTGLNGVGALSKLVLSQSIAGRILSVKLDSRDMPPNQGATQRTMFVASWTNQPGPGTGGVYKVRDNGDGTARVTKMFGSVLDPIKPTWDSLDANPTAGAVVKLAKGLLPYPLFFDTQLIRTSLFLEQHPLAPDFIYTSTVAGGVWTRAADCAQASSTAC